MLVTLKSLLITLHAIAGTAACFAAILAMMSPKGRKIHRLVGRCFCYAMGVVVVTALPLSIWINSWFFLAISFFSGYHAYKGWRFSRPGVWRANVMDKTIYLAFLQARRAVTVCASAIVSP